MTIKDRFLNEAKIGSNVEIIIGPKEIAGTIVSLDLSTVKILKDDGKQPTVALDSISYFEITNTIDSASEDDDKKDNVVSEKVLIAEQTNDDETTPEQLSGAESDSSISNNSPEKTDELNNDIFTILSERGDTYFSRIEAPVFRDYKEIATSEISDIHSNLLNIANSIDYAFKQLHEESPADTKIQENIKSLRRLIHSGNENNASAASMLGALYYQCKSDRLALEAYKDGDDNVSAFAVAQSINAMDYMEMFASRHFVLDDDLNTYIVKWLIERMIATRDYSLLSFVNRHNATDKKLPGLLASLKAILLANGINYNSMLDYDATPDSLMELLSIFKQRNIESEVKLIKYIQLSKVKPVVDEKPASEYKTYFAAKYAREQEMDFDKAEKLYIEAIMKNERPSAASADLVGLMMQKRNYYKASTYLGQYGSKFMREEAYKNLCAQLTNKDPKFAHIISYSERKEIQIDYFILAQKAELEEKDLQKSISYYKEAIKRRQRLTGSVPNLVSIYTRLEMFDDALSLLDGEGRQCMELAKYLNLRLSVFSTAKDAKYKDKIIDTYNKVIDLSKSKEKKADLLFSEALLMNQIREYDEAIKLYSKAHSWINNGYYQAPEKADKQKINAYSGLCNAYIQLRDFDNAKKNALKILEIQPQNEFANSVIKGSVDEDSKFVEDTIGVTKISDYFIQRINKLSLENELKNKRSISNGTFTGTPEEAESIITAIRHQQIKVSVNDEIQSNNYFAIAKIIRQILDRDEEIEVTSAISEKAYQLDVAIGSYFYGNYRLYRTEFSNNFDAARYCFFETISMFQDSEKVPKCWMTATIRYIETYFCTTENIKKNAKIYYSFSREVEKEYKNTIIDIMRKSITSDVTEFVVGMLEMLTYNKRVKKLVLSLIYKNPMSARIFDVLGSIGDVNIPDGITEEQFEQFWELASNKYYIKRKQFLRTIELAIETVFIVGQHQENYERFSNSEFHRYLNSTDKDFIADLNRIFLQLRRYNEESEFDYKSDTLSNVDEIRSRLVEKIADNPTYIGYEKLLPMLNQLQAKIFKESSQLYGESQPEIRVTISGDCSIEENDFLIRVPIAFTNKNNVQNADNVSIKITGQDVEVINDEQRSRILLPGNGKAIEELVEFKGTPEVISEQVISVLVTIQYQYKKSMTELTDNSVEIPLSIPLYSDSTFEEIENKFEPYRNGSEVKEPSMFYGRDNDINSIIEQISDSSGNVLRGRCLALYGQTRTGKSSLLYHLEQRLRNINEEANVIINVGSIGEENLSGNNITEFLYTLLDELNYEIQSKHPRLKSILTEYGLEINAENLLIDKEHSQLYFNDVFRKLNRCIENSDAHYNIIVMIDEFTYIYDWIRKGIMTDQIMKFWKAFIQNNGIFAIIIGQDHMMKFVEEKQFTNDFGSTDLRKVTYLPEEDAKRLMYEPIMLTKSNGEKVSRYKEGALDRLYELTAGSAFLIMNLCAGLVDYLNQTHSVFITRAHVDDYLKKNLSSFEEARFFEPQYDDKSNAYNDETIMENKRILHKIARRSNNKEWTPLINVIENEHDKKLIDSLEKRDVIIITNNDRCKIKVALYKEWIIAKYGLEGVNG